MANYTLLEKITVGAAGASSVTFSGIPQTGYTDLLIKASVRSTAAVTRDQLSIQFNGSSANQSQRYLFGIPGLVTGSGSDTNLVGGYFSGASSTSTTFGNQEIYIPNYTSANFKSYSADGVSETNATDNGMMLVAGLLSSTAAITSIAFSSYNAGNFVQGSTFYLYGVAKLGTTPAIVPYATGGDTIMTDGTYWYHTFTSSGTFTPQKSLSCDYLVVAGGGGTSGSAGNDGGYGGGGAGGYRTSIGGSPLSLGTSAYTVTIGAGGAGGASGSGNAGSKGGDSTFSTITSTGGGLTQASSNAGGAGGSGGGGRVSGAAGLGNQGSYSPSEGNNGGTGNAVSYGGGGGGGAGAVGASTATGAGGNGGNGTANSISGSSVTYAGGGGGGGYNNGGNSTGGTGGGGAGRGDNGIPSNGTANTGGGAGATGGIASGGVARAGASGGSGIVIVRYAV